jgi:HlyD family secretion protein
MVKWASIVLAVCGTLLALYTVATVGTDAPPRPAPAAAPAVNPFARGIAAGGTVEAASRNVPVAAPESGLVVSVLAEVGQAVKRGEPLMELDGRLLKADLKRAEAARLVAAAELAQLRAQPRAEELPPLRAAAERSRVRLADVKDQLEEVMGARSMGGVSPTEVQRRRFAVLSAEADVAQAEAQLKLAEAGAWGPLVAVAEARLAQAEAEIEAIRIKLDRLTVRSPVDGVVLKRNVEPGQFAGVGGPEAGWVLGDLRELRVRARVDEEDVPMLRSGAAAVARVRGQKPEELKLEMIRIEPLAVPKQQLLGTTTERVDTRVVEVVFRLVSTPRSSIYPGQAVDVFIEVSEGAGGAGGAGARGGGAGG